MFIALLATVALADDAAPADRNTQFQFQIAQQFLPESPAFHLSGRMIGERDGWLGAETRYAPTEEWMGRVSGGIDLFGGSNWDAQFGAFIGAAGTYDPEGFRMSYRPQAGGEIAVAGEMGWLYGRYRWLFGFGAEPLDRMLTENELSVGLHPVEPVRVFGQYLWLGQGRTGVGIGAQVTF